ncbi:MAG TPA: ATP-binding protein [Spirochaetota bacterium]|nr:ATP-binding protein [Spirochaetota bacterium]HOL56996.1 ATP-binding protein [Spirochaetota bacterium]HPP03836.1 ATP-binding protein [Spirochaetota bacterium]
MNYNISIKPDVVEIEVIKSTLIKEIKISDTNLLHQIEMAFSELVENAVKYSDKSLDKNIEISIEYNDHIKISVSNYVSRKSHINNLINIIEKIKSVNKNDNLYLKRIKEIIDRKSHGKSQMGLYRIFYEGDFELDYSFDNSIKKLSITAKKNSHPHNSHTRIQ